MTKLTPAALAALTALAEEVAGLYIGSQDEDGTLRVCWDREDGSTYPMTPAAVLQCIAGFDPFSEGP